jgi:hypothetical protein
VTPVIIMAAYAAAARPVLRRFLPVNSCVAATRVTIECLRHFGIEAIPRAAKWVVEFPDSKLAYTTGLTPEERSSARETIPYAWADTEAPWNGHLIAMTGEFLIDPSFEQAIVALNRKPEDRVAIFPVTGDPRDSCKLIEFGAVTDAGERVTITYITTEDDTWNGSEAWTDPDLRLVEAMIIESMKTALSDALNDSLNT